jgi:serine/threonine-protein kinase
MTMPGNVGPVGPVRPAGMPPGPAFATWPPVPPRRSRAPLWVLLAVLIAVLLALGLWGVRTAMQFGGGKPAPSAPRGTHAAAADEEYHLARRAADSPASIAEYATVEVEANEDLDRPVGAGTNRSVQRTLATSPCGGAHARSGDLPDPAATGTTPSRGAPIGPRMAVRCGTGEPTG